MKKKLLVGLLAATCLTGLVGCDYETTETQYTDEIKNQINDAYGFPNVTNFFEYSQLKEIYELRDNPKLICHWYIKNDMSGKFVYQGTCIGYGIPYGSSITAPEAVQRIHDNGGAYEVTPLAEPNGLYNNGVTSSATWILTTDAEGNITPTYVESEITVSQSKINKNLCEDWSIPTDY